MESADAYPRRPPPMMLKAFLTGLLILPSVTSAQVLPAGAWEVRSTVVTLDVPGLPGFLQRMAKGHTSTERKCVPSNQSVAALLAPDPKAKCRVDRTQIGGGRYDQTLTCPQRDGKPMTVTRSGTYDANGFTGRAVVAGLTKKGPMMISMDQHAVRVGDRCGG